MPKEQPDHSGHQPPSSLSLDQRMAQVGQLLGTFGAAADIPDDVLSQLGYTKVRGEDDTVRLIPVEKLAELTQPAQQKERQLPNKQAPFEPITIALGSEGKTGRLIEEAEEIAQLAKRLEAVAINISGEWHYESENPLTNPTLENLTLFMDDFEETLPEIIQEFSQVDDEWIISRLLHYPLPNNEDGDDNEPYFTPDEFLAEHRDPDNYIIRSDKAAEMHDELSRLMGRYGDIPELRRIFTDSLNTSVEPAFDTPPGDISFHPVRKLFAEHGVTTYADFIRFAFPLYLQNLGFDEMAQVIKNAPDLTTIAGQLTAIKLPVSQREKEIRQEVKDADMTRRSVLNEERKELETQRKHLEKIRTGIINYFNAPTLYAQLCKQSIQSAQDFLIRNQKAQERVEIVLDPTPNFELDANPGKVSGDCTEDRPLPFNMRDDAHNVKVFRGIGDNKKHIGNIYLLETYDTSDQKVWHIDAIQIPYAGLNWNEFVTQIFTRLAGQAQAKDIDAITVNGEDDFLLSNYDYIQDAVKRYWEQTAKEITEVEMPLVEQPGHSAFQGRGEALVLWSR